MKEIDLSKFKNLLKTIGQVGQKVRQWSGRAGFNPRSIHSKDLKNGT